MLRELALASVALAFAGTIGVVVIATRRVVVARREQRSAEERLTPAALAVAFESVSEFPQLSKRDAIVFAALLGRFSARLRGGSRERIAQYFERQGRVHDAIAGLSDRRSWRRATAAYALGDMGSPTAVPALVGALEDEAREVRSAAARSLGQLGAMEAVEPLVAALSSRLIPRGVVGQSVLALGAQAVPRLVPLLARADPEVRATAAELIGLLGGAGEEEHLIGRLADTSSVVRRRAAIALSRIGAADSYDGLDGTLGDRAAPVRAAAAEALGLIGNARAFPALLDVARSDAFEPARAAARALARLAPDLLQQAAREPGAGPFLREAAETAALEAGAP
jgi:HEAT repeat protein